MNRTHRLGMALTCLHASTALHVLVAIALVALAVWAPEIPDSPPIATAMLLGLAGVCLLIGLVPQVAAMGIRRRRMWGWILGLILFGLYLPSIFLPLGALGLWGLLDENSRAEFGMGAARSTPTTPST